MTIRSALITGGAGQLATDLKLVLEDRAKVAAPDHAALDVTDEKAVGDVLAALRPDVVFNCAAFHNVDQCESREDEAWATNVRAVKRLAEGCAAVGARLVHLSTNYVFDGTAEDAYSERDLPSPRSVYGLTKLAGEYAAMTYAPGPLVVRTAGLYGLAGSAAKGGNFVQRMLARGRAGERIDIVDDQRASPTFTADLAPAIIAAVEAKVDGVIHLTSSGSCSWYEFTLAILAAAGLETVVAPAKTERRPGYADRPLNGVLACDAAEVLGIAPLRPWQEALLDYLARVGLAAKPASYAP